MEIAVLDDLSIAAIVFGVIVAVLCLRAGRQRDRFDRHARHSHFYVAYMQSEAWAAKRREKLREAGYRCQRRGSHGGRLEVHHRHYETLGHERMSDLEALCAFHHGIADEERRALNIHRAKERLRSLARTSY